jgi:hypothetical protein
MLRGQNVEVEDIAALAQILEHERKTAASKRAACFGLSTMLFLLLVAAFGLMAFAMLEEHDDLFQSLVPIGSVLTGLSAGVLTFFHLGCGAQNCIHSIERSLVAARHGRHKLFVTFVEQVQCADKNKKELIMEWVGVLTG